MNNITKTTHTSKRTFLHASLALALLSAIVLCSTTAYSGQTMDWSGVNTGNQSNWDWTAGVLDHSTSSGSTTGVKGNFIYISTDLNAASGNTLTIRDPSNAAGQITGNIFGGYSSEPGSTLAINSDVEAIDGNSVTVFAPTSATNPAISATDNVNVYGGFKYYSGKTIGKVKSISNNNVTIYSGVNLGEGTVAGGWFDSHHSDAATITAMTGNHVLIYGGTMGRIAGAALDSNASNLAQMDNNSVTINLKNGGNFNLAGTGVSGKTIYGADFQGGDVVNNAVYFYADNTSTIADNIGNIIGGRSGHKGGSAINNTTVIDFTARTTAMSVNLGDVKGGSSGNNTIDTDVPTFGTNNAYNNNLYISGSLSADVKVKSAVGAKVYGGIATGNNVYLTDVTVLGSIAAPVVGVVGGYAVNSKGTSDDKEGVADNNTVTILRGNILSDIYGGYDVSTTGQSADGNSVTITDATVRATNVFGGSSTASATTGSSKNNSVHIAGRNTVFNVGTLAGGSDNASSDNLDNNTLTTSYALNLNVDTLKNFQNYVYNMSSYEMEQTVYNVTNAVNIEGTNHTLNFDATIGPPLYEGQILTLIKTTDGVNSPTQDDFVKNIKDGFLYNYDSFFGMKGTDVVFEILGKRQDDRNVTFGQSQLVGLQMVNVAADLARSISGLCSIIDDDPCADPCYDPCAAPQRKSGPVVFAGTQGGTSAWNTGYDSRVNLRHISMATGLGWRFGDLLLAGFLEGGYGRYDAKVSGYKVVDDEKANYIGGGVMARYERGGFYGEAGFHAGRVTTYFNSARFGNAVPVHVQYKNKSTYFGADAVLGYKFDTGASTFDLSGRYSWNHAQGKDFVTREVLFEQDSANSRRIRAGGEWSYNLSSFKPYAGAFYEYEFNAESGHKVLGDELHRASKKGSNGIGTLGVRFGGGETGRFSADIGIEGYVGKRRGLAGKALVGYSF